MKSTLEKYSRLPQNFFLLIFWNTSFAIFVIFLIKGILTLMGYSTATLDSEEVSGLSGFVVNLVVAPLMALVVSFIFWLTLLFGNFVLRLILRWFT